MICSLTILSDWLYSLLIPDNHLSSEREVFMYLVVRHILIIFFTNDLSHSYNLI